MTALLMFGGFALLLILGVPIALSLGVSTMAAIAGFWIYERKAPPPRAEFPAASASLHAPSSAACAAAWR